MLKGSRIFKNQSKIVFRSDCLLRSKHSNEGFNLMQAVQTSKSFHKSQASVYPATKELPLPLNIEDLASSEKLKFSPHRNRDINGSYISSSTNTFEDGQQDKKNTVDHRVECYDCSGAINLSSAMQTNVPFPFISRGKPIHLNMPGGQWGQKEKYVSEELNNVHHTNTTQSQPKCGTSIALGIKSGAKNLSFYFSNEFYNGLQSPFVSLEICQVRNFCTAKEKLEAVEKNLNNNSKAEVPQLSRKDKFKAAIKDYGAVIIVFHVGLSLLSLGCCYALVASGIDLSYIFKEFGSDDGGAAAGTAAHFIIAYAVHKTMAPGRIAITLTAVPFVVKKLRKIGILRTPKAKLQ